MASIAYVKADGVTDSNLELFSNFTTFLRLRSFKRKIVNFRSLEELYLDIFVGEDDHVSLDDFSFGIEKLQLQVKSKSETIWGPKAFIFILLNDF